MRHLNPVIAPIVFVLLGWPISLDADVYWPGFFLSIMMVVVFLAGGLFYFRRMERTFADVI